MKNQYEIDYQQGYDNANDVQVRIPYQKNKNLNINNFAIGDIIVEGNNKTFQHMAPRD